MNALLLTLVLTNLAWCVICVVLATTRSRKGHQVHIHGPQSISIEGYSARQTARLLDLVEEMKP